MCSGTIDVDRVRVALARGKVPRYCSGRCYRAGIKRTYRAKRCSIVPPANAERRAEATATLDTIGDGQRAYEDGRDEMRAQSEAREESCGASGLPDVVRAAEIFSDFFGREVLPI